MVALDIPDGPRFAINGDLVTAVLLVNESKDIQINMTDGEKFVLKGGGPKYVELITSIENDRMKSGLILHSIK